MGRKERIEKGEHYFDSKPTSNLIINFSEKIQAYVNATKTFSFEKLRAFRAKIQAEEKEDVCG